MKISMNVTHVELQNILGERLREVLRKDLSAEERQVVNEQSRLVLNFANNMINNSNFILQAEKVLAENNNLDASVLKNLVCREHD